MDDESTTRAQRLAKQLVEKRSELVAMKVLPPDMAQGQHTASDTETTEQRERRRAALAKLRTFVE